MIQLHVKILLVELPLMIKEDFLLDINISQNDLELEGYSKLNA